MRANYSYLQLYLNRSHHHDLIFIGLLSEVFVEYFIIHISNSLKKFLT